MIPERVLQARHREEWLTACLALLRSHFGRVLRALPQRIRVACSWTYHVGERGARPSPAAPTPPPPRGRDFA